MNRDETHDPVRPGPFVRVSRLIGDFGNPFFAEERQRDVWNEASAVGLQVVLWSTFLVATGTVWVVGEPAVPYTTMMFVIASLGSLFTLVYCERVGVDLGRASGMLIRRPVVLALTALTLLYLAGVLRATVPADDPGEMVGFVLGALVGGAGAIGAFELLRRGWRRRAGAAEDPEAD